MFDPKGSVWRKWDLHVHTPASHVNGYGGADAWDRFLEGLEALPPDFRVIGINDYIFLDGYKRILEERAKGRLQNLELILPVIELRLDKFGGSGSPLSKVNFHAVFSDELSADVISAQFLSALSSKYQLTPSYAEAGKTWSMVPTRESLEELGRLIIDSVPTSERDKFHAPIIEGFNNLCFSFNDIRDILNKSHFDRKVLTAIGKTEWADVKWNDHSIADKKTIINAVDLVFISAESPEAYQKAQTQLAESQVNALLVDCSDAHTFADAEAKDRLGNCFTWIKSDPTFEGLRQALYEFPTRVSVQYDPPREPPIKIRTAVINLPADTQITGKTGPEPFCFRGNTEIVFSPYLTCLIGGRGSGKSTILNILHERLGKGSTKFFEENTLLSGGELSLDPYIQFEGTFDTSEVEFLEQNEIEQFASDADRFTDAVFTRLRKLDREKALTVVETEIDRALAALAEQKRRTIELHSLHRQIVAFESERAAKQALVESFQDEEYKAISDNLGKKLNEFQGLMNSRQLLEAFIKEIEGLVVRTTALAPVPRNAYDTALTVLAETVGKVAADARSDQDLAGAAARVNELKELISREREALQKFLAGRGLSQENLSDVGQAGERVAQIDQSLPAMKARLDALTLEVQGFEHNRELLQDYSTCVQALLTPVNDKLSNLATEVKPIAMRYAYDRDRARAAIIKFIQNSIKEGERPRVDHIELAMESVKFSELTTAQELSAKLVEHQKTTKVLRDHFLDVEQFALLKLEVEREILNVRAHAVIHVTYDKKAVESTSFGQRCTAAIVILLLLGNTPIVIDEPEAHLDSSLIAKYLVELVKSVKWDRQIIFATHNANFVINGDAELIHLLSMGEDGRSQIESATIEDLSKRDRLLALEGGQDAFLRRELRYGIK